MGLLDDGCGALVVEDDLSNREFLCRLLRGCDIVVDSASTVGEAIEKLSATPKVVLLDMRLPDGSGVDVLHFIRAKRLATVVGVITGSAEDECLAELRTFIPDRVFIKPIEVSELLTWVQAYVSHRRELNVPKLCSGIAGSRAN